MQLLTAAPRRNAAIPGELVRPGLNGWRGLASHRETPAALVAEVDLDLYQLVRVLRLDGRRAVWQAGRMAVHLRSLGEAFEIGETIEWQYIKESLRLR